MKVSKVAVVGAGNIGSSLAVDLALNGIETTLIDNSAEALEKASQEIKDQIRFARILKPSITKEQVEQAKEKITYTLDLEAAAPSDFLVENVTEDWDIKASLYPQLDRICAPETPFGANTSCISITRIGSLTNRPEKIIGIHFMNPVFKKMTVEVIRGDLTAEDTLNRTNAFLEQMGKEAVVVNDLPGFVSNRISHLFINEAAFVVMDQVATPAQVDKIFKKCYGHTMGPLETADLIGIDTVVNSIDVLYESYQDSKFRCCPLLRKMAHAGKTGRKAGEGFFKYPTR